MSIFLTLNSILKRETPLPEAGVLTIKLSREVNKGDIINFKMKYDGKLGTTQLYGYNRLTEEWIELGLYFPWFPITIKQLDEKNLTYEIKVEVDPEYKIFGLGKTIKEDGFYKIIKEEPGLDIIIIGAKSLHQIVKNFNTFDFKNIDSKKR